jgi:penicillin amidase
VLKRLLWTVLVLVILAGAGAWWWLRSSIPALDGEIPAIGLRAPVEVLFDPAAVPHVYARDAEDAWFAAGVLHARDRLWQMELYRRATMGRLSEALGESTLPIDRRMLLLGLRESAEAEFKRTEPQVRTALERYAEGVNSVVLSLSSSRRQLPVELQLLGITPAPWTPVDSLAVGRLLSWRLAENHQSELVRAALASALGLEAARELGGRYPRNAPTVLDLREDPGTDPPTAAGDSARSGDGAADSTRETARGSWPAGLDWLRPSARRGNSNNWVIAPARTASGRPILANDPHLQIEFPSVWYEMHLVAAGLDVIGVTIPGVPFVIIGHNARIAWGFTNSGADVQDLYVERLDVARKRYMSASGWQAAEVTRVDIPVRGRETPEPFEIWRTPRGPIYAERGALDFDEVPSWMTPGQSPAAEPELNTATVVAYALKWESGAGDSAAAFEQFNRATDWASFTAAVELFAEPSQNIVYADVDGNIGYALNGRLPSRTSGDGAFPTDAGAGGGEWGTPVAASALPRVLNPVSGFITSSNNAIDRGGSPFITGDWGGAFRAARLHDALSTERAATLEAMATLQNDRRSLAATQVLAGVEGALARAKSSQVAPAVVDTLTRLAAWDRIVDGRPIVTLYQAFEDALWRRTFSDDMDEPLFRAFYEWAGADRPAGLYMILDDPRSRWWDDIGTVEARETRDDIFLLAAADADRRLRGDFGSEAEQAWDRVHAARFVHPLGSASRALAWMFDGGTSPIGGDGTTVMRVSWNRLEPFHAWEIPSWRQILDVGNWDESRVILPTGQAGHLLSPHRFDQNERWRTGQYRPQPFTRAAVESARAHRLVLVP